MIIGYQGEIGSYSHNSLKKFFKNEYQKLISYKSFEEIFIALKDVEITHGYIPIENTIGGKLHDNIRFIKEYNTNIIETYKYKINHCLLTYPDSKKDKIIDIYSHWQALSQCSNYLHKNNFISKEYYDTSGACKYILDNKLKNIGAIASKECSKIYNLDIIDENIQNNDNNYTTFVLINVNKTR